MTAASVPRAVSGRLIDATLILTANPQNPAWRLHLQYDLADARPVGLELTDLRGAETLTRHTVPPDTLVVADRGSAHRQALGTLVAQGTAFVVRTNGHNLPLVLANGAHWDWVGWLERCTGALAETQVWLETPTGLRAVRLIAARLPAVPAAQARRRASQASRRQGHTPSRATLIAAEFVLLVTNLPSEVWSAESVSDCVCS